jgi:hypothetical protein
MPQPSLRLPAFHGCGGTTMNTGLKWLAVGALLALAAPRPVHAQAAAEASIAPLKTVMLMELEGEVAIDAAGLVTDVGIATPVNDALRAGVTRVVRDWKFEPVVVDGVAVPARAKARILLGSRPTSAVDKVWVDGVTFVRSTAPIELPNAQLTVSHLDRPRYPPGMRGVAGRVLVAMRIGLDGRVADAAVVQSALRDVVGEKHELQQAIDQFERASLAAARRWRFTVVVREGAQPSADELTVMVPVEFSTASSQRMTKGDWRLHVRAPRQSAPWLSDEGKRLANDAADVGEAPSPVAGGLRLRSPVGEGAVL